MAIAVLLAAEGARVTIVDRDVERAQYTQGLIEAEGNQALAVIADISDDLDCGRAVEATLERFGRLDILVNNAGITGGGPSLEALDLSVWQRTLDVNLKGALMMARRAVPAMKAVGGGSMIHIASVAGLLSSGGGFAYGPSKGGMIALSRDIAVAYGRAGIRSNVICPGHMFTPLVSDMPAEKRTLRRKIAPLGVEGDAWDIAEATVFLASDAARFISGACLPVDGGATVTLGLRSFELAGE